ncbi:uncharacterized protein PHACADRAFT_207564 [Phanerochaete carnosa HHB-10118-sp]|uniref:DUF6533 domain-containing protein n=1 Tax=Phanerochaete carnosa (strain HHB-10118-sp) TaxID=650164 RepID=K5WAR4_PHACS|nr:uncharacterized protein PHACADRAFT_207564 [Phanerochaete carnosa HHB-10118-sp]EKM56285.1 hypothetical protein PHACADRAFT_207564 [Phanerochaete carnosa HHB-10118-sp]
MAQSNGDLKQELQVLLAQDYVSCSLIALVTYEYVVTLDQEIAVVWKRKFTATSMMLLSTRWLMLWGVILMYMPAKQTSSITTLTSLFSALRVYALWQQSRMKYVFTTIVFMLGLVPVGTNIFASVHTVLLCQDIPIHGTYCSNFVNIQPKLTNDAIAADIAVLALTWVKSFKQFQEMRRLELGSSISTVLLRDGSLYFVALLAMNILQLLTFTDAFVEANYADAFLQFMPAVLVQRFMLNLRQLSFHTDDQESISDAQHFSLLSINFRAPSDFLGNIGEPLDYDQLELIEDDSGDSRSSVAEEQGYRPEGGFVQHASVL